MGKERVFSNEEIILGISKYISVGASLRYACKMAGFNYSMVTNRKQTCEEFQELYDKLDDTKFVALCSVKKGIKKDSRLALDYLKSRHSDKFGGKSKVLVGGMEDAEPIKMEHAGLSSLMDRITAEVEDIRTKDDTAPLSED